MDPMTIAAIVGALTSAAGGVSSMFSKPQQNKARQFPSLLPESMQAVRGAAGGFGQALPQGLEYLQGLLGNSQESMDTFQAPYMRMFNEQIVPGIAERFSGLGAGAQSSSAFQQSLGQAGAGLSEMLASLHQNMKGNALSQLFNLGNLGTTQAFSTGIEQTPRSRGDIFGEALGGIGSSMMSQGLKRMPLTWGNNSPAPAAAPARQYGTWGT